MYTIFTLAAVGGNQVPVYSDLLVSGTYAPGYAPPVGGATPVTSPASSPLASPASSLLASPSGGSAPHITITAFPAKGALTPITGTVTGLGNPASYIAILYVRDGAGVNFWCVCMRMHAAAVALADARNFACERERTIV